MFLRNETGLDLAGGTAARPIARALVRLDERSPMERLRIGMAMVDWVPDLGTQIGTRAWWRGLATCTALCAATWALSPVPRALIGGAPTALSGAESDEARAQAIAPLAWGADTGRHLAASDLVVALAETPERPSVDLTATLGEGDSLAQMLQRAGVGRGDAQTAAAMIARTTPIDAIAPGTRIALTLGRRPSKSVPRPLDKLDLRARFDLAVSIARAGPALIMTQRPIAIDTTPLRLRGLVGASLYRSARAAGAPAKAVEAYIRALATRLSVGGDIHAADGFDLVIDRQRAATGETRLGDLLFAGLDQSRRRTRLVRWTIDGRDGWYDADGQIERRGQMGMPVAGHITSNFGWRMHPLLGFMKLHKGLDIGAAYGSPIHAVVDGIVTFAGRAGGYGNFVKVDHAGGLVSGYGHMSRIAVRSGAHVGRGDVIGYVGSTGLSTGPHLHWEIWRNGVSINPRSIAFDNIERLSGNALRLFKARVASLTAVKPGR